MDTSKSEKDRKDDFVGDGMMAAQDDTPFAHEHQVDKGFSDLEVVPTPDLEVAGSDSSQAIPPPVYRPKFTEQQSFALGLSSPKAAYRPNSVSYFSYSPTESKTRDFNYNGGHGPFHSLADPEKKRRIWGLERKIFWILLAVVLLGIVLAIAVGLGVGLGLRSTDSASSRYVTLQTWVPSPLPESPLAFGHWQAHRVGDFIAPWTLNLLRNGSASRRLDFGGGGGRSLKNDPASRD